MGVKVNGDSHPCSFGIVPIYPAFTLTPSVKLNVGVPVGYMYILTEDRSCHGTEWSENILCGGRHLFYGGPGCRV